MMLIFLQKLVPHRSLTLPWSRSDFGFKFAEISKNESTTQQVSESATLQLGESATL
jgi:hypothetical protein